MKRDSSVEHPIRPYTVREQEDEVLRLRQHDCQGGWVNAKTHCNCIAHLLDADGRAGAAHGDQQGTTQSGFSLINRL
jgi:hypothetical protein